MTRVYRVQDASGRGPWRPGFSERWIEADAPAGRLTETIFDLMPFEAIQALAPDLHWGSACRSLDDLLRWFTPYERRRLHGYGFHPVQLNADVVAAQSDWQMLVGRFEPFAEGATRLRWRA